MCVGNGLGTSSETTRRPEIMVVTWSDERQPRPIEGLAVQLKKRFRRKIRARGSRVLSPERPEKEGEGSFSRNTLWNQPL